MSWPWLDPPQEYVDIVRKHLPTCPIDEVAFFLGEIVEIATNEESFDHKRRLLEEYESLEAAFLGILRAAKKASWEPLTEAFSNWQTSFDLEDDPEPYDFLEEVRSRLKRVQRNITRIRAELNSAPHSASRDWKALEIA